MSRPERPAARQRRWRSLGRAAGSKSPHSSRFRSRFLSMSTALRLRRSINVHQAAVEDTSVELVLHLPACRGCQFLPSDRVGYDRFNYLREGCNISLFDEISFLFVGDKLGDSAVKSTDDDEALGHSLHD